MQRPSIDQLQASGEFIYTTRQGVEGHTGMIICCPGCGKQSAMQLSHEGQDTGRPTWTKTGTDIHPTLHPSVNATGCCGWHGWLKNGVWTHV